MKHHKLHIKRRIFHRHSTLIFLFLFLGYANASVISKPSQQNLDKKIQAGFDALNTKNWKQAQLNFEEALKIHEKTPDVSQIIAEKLGLIPSKATTTSKTTKKDEQLREKIDGFRASMATLQSLYTFASFSSQLAGDNKAAEKYFNQIEDMRGPLWGKSWYELIPEIHKIFFSQIKPDKNENYGNLLFLAGKLFLNVDSLEGINLFKEAKPLLPTNPAPSALLASYMITHNDPVNAKIEAESSLSLNPRQVSVWIDLATAEWLLKDFDKAVSAAKKASELNSTLPGPHATLAFVALEKGDNTTALKEAELGDKLSNGHAFYKTILAVCIEATGDAKQAKKIFAETWKDELPDEALFTSWFFRGLALKYALQLLKQQETKG